MKAADYISQFLEEKGVQVVFELSGGMITHMLDAFQRRGKIKCISMHHEQGASFAADAIGRMTGLPGIALATSGPGATNLLTGIGSAYFDSSPTVFITGQVNRHEQKGTKQVRQLGFQETDIVSMAEPITKAAWKVKTVEELPELLEKAFVLATNGRPGPVLLDVPMDIQRLELDLNQIKIRTIPAPQKPSLEGMASEILDKISQAQRPLFLVGGGLRSLEAVKQFRSLAKLVNVPVVHSLLAVDVMPYNDPLRVGMIGSYGNRWANLAIGKSDLVVVLGSRLDVRQTGSEAGSFKNNKEIYHVDCEAGEINNRVTGCTPIVSELSPFLEVAYKAALKRNFNNHAAWQSEVLSLKQEWSDEKELAGVKGINPNHFMHALSRSSNAASAFVVDVGQHQMWAAQSLELNEAQRFLTSGGMGAMGFALPAAIGAAYSQPEKPVVMIAGDGGFQCNIQELQTIARNRLPIKLIIINNRCHGMVRQFQESYFDSRYQSTLWGYSAPDFVKVSDAYNIPGRRVERSEDLAEALCWLWAEPNQPALLDVVIDTFANAYPKIAFGRPITDMEPFVKPTEMEGT